MLTYICKSMFDYRELKKRNSLIIFILLVNVTFAQKVMTHELKDVVVTAGRTAVEFSDLTRSVYVLNQKDIEKIPVNDIQDLLQYVAGVDLKQRGVDGVQADISIRGGSFNQTLILIDGIKVTDPQTGHHNLNIPLSLGDIQRVEILKGQGSRVHGPNAFSGVINIITKKGNVKELSLIAIGGQNGYYSTSLSVAYPTRILKSRISFNRKQSDGYIHNTDFKNKNFSYNGSVNLKNVLINTFAGYNDKQFGANKFYSARFPEQWEHTKTTFVNTSVKYFKKNFLLDSKVYFRKNKDDYILIKDHPEIYENHHESNTYGAELQSTFNYKNGSTSIGGEFIKDKIKSTNLGNHKREKKGVFVEQRYFPSENLTLVGGFFAYDYAFLGWKFWPGLEAAYKFKNSSRIYANIGKSFRLPTYTELYYLSPTNNGNPNLKSEETLNYELGFVFNSKNVNINGSIFRKEGKNLIDWTRKIGTDVWKAQNISKINTTGYELGLKVKLNKLLKQNILIDFQLDYTWLQADKTIGKFNESKYLLDFLRHQLIGKILNKLPFALLQSWIFRYEDRVNFGDSFIVDTQISKKFTLFSIFVRATNLFDRSYSDIVGVVLPGRWITMGVKLNIGKVIF